MLKVTTSLSFSVSYNYGTPIAIVEKERISVDSTDVISFLQTAVTDLMTPNPATPYGIVGLTIGIHRVTLNEQAIFTLYYDLDTIN